MAALSYVQYTYSTRTRYMHGLMQKKIMKNDIAHSGKRQNVDYHFHYMQSNMTGRRINDTYVL